MTIAVGTDADKEPVMAWKPKSESSCLPMGEHDAEVISVKQATSKRGKPMVVITLGVTFQDRRFYVKDYLSEGPFGREKTECIAASLGEAEALAAGTFRLRELTNKTVRAFVTLERTEAYGYQNRVERYMLSGLGRGPDCVGVQPKPVDDADELPEWLRLTATKTKTT